MSTILKRPMFRRGGMSNDGILDLAIPRKQYQEAGPVNFDEAIASDPFGKQTYELLKSAYGRDVEQEKKDILSNLLIKGGLGLVSGEGAGKGTLGAIATAFKDPTEQALSELSKTKTDPAKIAAAQAVIAQRSARELKEIEALGKESEVLMKTYGMGKEAVKSYFNLREQLPQISQQYGVPIGRNVSGDPVVQGQFIKGKLDYKADLQSLGPGVYTDPYNNKIVVFTRDKEAIVVGDAQPSKQTETKRTGTVVSDLAPEISEEDFGPLVP